MSVIIRFIRVMTIRFLLLGLIALAVGLVLWWFGFLPLEYVLMLFVFGVFLQYATRKCIESQMVKHWRRH